MKTDELLELRKSAETALHRNIVFSDGDPHSRIMFIGEAPGRLEEEQGKPFVGSAGKTLNKALEKAGMKREDVYITNTVLWRPPKNRRPTKQELEKCRPFLLGQIRIVSPKLICTLGNTPLEFFGRKEITKVHGKPIDMELDGMKLKIVPTFHPAAILYNRSLLRLFENDIASLLSL